MPAVTVSRHVRGGRDRWGRDRWGSSAVAKRVGQSSPVCSLHPAPLSSRAEVQSSAVASLRRIGPGASQRPCSAQLGLYSSRTDPGASGPAGRPVTPSSVSISAGHRGYFQPVARRQTAPAGPGYVGTHISMQPVHRQRSWSNSASEPRPAESGALAPPITVNMRIRRAEGDFREGVRQRRWAA